MAVNLRHGMMLCLLQGVFGDSRYNNILLQGRGGGRCELLAYLALYADGKATYVSMAEDAPDETTARRQLVGLSCPAPENAERTLSLAAQAIVIELSEEDAWMVRALSLAAPDKRGAGLPFMFVTWTRRTVDKRLQIVFWHPSEINAIRGFIRFRKRVKETS